ncbi:transferase [Streptomyces sp. QTS137]
MSTAAQDTGAPRAHCTVDADGRTAFRVALRSAGRPRLALVPRTGKNAPEPPTRLLELEPHGGDESCLHAVLEPLPALAEGRWDAYLMREPDAVRERLRPGLRDLRALVDGSLRERPSPVAVRVPYATKDGFLAVRAWLRTAHAEAGRLDLADGAMTVNARLHGAELSDGATALLRLRSDKGTTRSFPARTEGGAFSFTASLGELTGGMPGDQVWDAFLRPAADAPLVRIGRLLDDLADRKAVYAYPALTVGEAAARPYYTVDNDLAVEVTAVH